MMVGIGLIIAALATLLSLVKKGWCLIYLQTAQDLDGSALRRRRQE